MQDRTPDGALARKDARAQALVRATARPRISGYKRARNTRATQRRNVRAHARQHKGHCTHKAHPLSTAMGDFSAIGRNELWDTGQQAGLDAACAEALSVMPGVPVLVHACDVGVEAQVQALAVVRNSELGVSGGWWLLSTRSPDFTGLATSDHRWWVAGTYGRSMVG